MSPAGKQNRYPCEQVVEIQQEPRHHLVFENEFVRAFAVAIGPRVRTLCHHHPNDYLLYVAGGAEIVSAARNEEPKQLNYRDGECELLSAGLVHVVDNLGDTVFRNVVVELLPAAGTLHRGAPPVTIKGDVAITQPLEDERAAVFKIEMERGAEVQVSAPAVGVTLFPDLPNSTATVTSYQFIDLSWLWPPGASRFSNTMPGPIQVIFFQIGSPDGVSLKRDAKPLPKDLRAQADETK